MNRYDDMLNLPHHVSPTRAHMSMHDRAAQFAPFAALTGYDAAVQEAARLTDTQIDLDAEQIDAINRQLWSLRERLDQRPLVSLCYFCPDERKSGGSYIRLEDRLRKIDEYGQSIILEDGTAIPMAQLIELQETEEPKEGLSP